MGMYDYVNILVACPVCGNVVRNDFQTKDFENMMDTYQPGDQVGTVCAHRLKSIRTYTTCDHHHEITKIEGGLVFTTIKGLWIEYEIPIIDGEISRDMNTWKRTTEPTMYNGLSCLSDDLSEDDIIELVDRMNAKVRRDILITKWEQTHIGKAPLESP